MTLQTYDVTQGSSEWDDLRRGMITASVVGQLITPSTLKPASNPASRSLTALLVSERITGWTEPTYMSDDMHRGMMDEPVARRLYAEEYKTDVLEVGFMIREEEWGTLGYSPDGLVGDLGLIEIKSRAPKKQLQTIISCEVPPENVMQCQAALLVTGRAWLDFVSFSGGMPLFVKRVYPDLDTHEAIKSAVASFELAAKEMVKQYRAVSQGFPTTERVDRIDPYQEATI